MYILNNTIDTNEQKPQNSRIRRSRFDAHPSTKSADSGVLSVNLTYKNSVGSPSPATTNVAPGIGNTPNSGSKLPLTLETCAVGIMATILRQEKMRQEANGEPFVPYKPLETSITPPDSISVEYITEYEKNRVADFYDELEELMDEMRDQITPDDPAFSYSKMKQYNVHKHRSLPISIISEQDIIKKHEKLYRESGGDADPWISSEFNTNAGGVAFRSAVGGSGAKHAGLGSISANVENDVFESYRRKRANKYHEFLAIKEAVRRDPNFLVVSSQDLCYNCNKPGHHAKDCKYVPH